MKDNKWQNSIRHNLSVKKAFAKLERETSIASGKGCFWTIVPGYEQQFIDNLMKRGMGGAACSSISVKNNISFLSCASDGEKFRKLIDASVKKPNSPLFTIFRMNSTTRASSSAIKRNKITRKKKINIKQNVQDLQYDSDCDSGVDFGCETHQNSPQGSTSTHMLHSAKSTSLPQYQKQQSYMDNSGNFFAEHSNAFISTTFDYADNYFEITSIPSSITMDQQLFNNSLTLDR
ncbi:hypothetical protein BD408DRAFT_443436 [Parasitella parasitica]|nr:hypothetical protein BD408DRAFT_443436 [Parasitella parasitica]